MLQVKHKLATAHRDRAGGLQSDSQTIYTCFYRQPKDRQDLVDTFQSNPSVRVALLGLTAAGIGITLTAASR